MRPRPLSVYPGGVSPIVRLDVAQQFAAINLLSDPGIDPGKHPIPNCCDFQILWNLADGKTARNILCMSVGAGFLPTVALAEQARAALVTGTNWSTYAGFLPTTVSLAAVNLRDRRAIDQPLVPSSGAVTPGTSASPAMPSEVAAVYTLRTNKVGPGNRGRVYLTGFATNAISPGDVMAPGLVTAIGAFAANIVNAMNGIGGTWAIRQPHRNGYTSPKPPFTVHPDRPAGVALVTASSVRDNHWDSQRRRGLR